jgi:hypothetical protein
MSNAFVGRQPFVRVAMAGAEVLGALGGIGMTSAKAVTAQVLASHHSTQAVSASNTGSGAASGQSRTVVD